MNPIAFVTIIVIVTLSFMVLTKLLLPEHVPHVGEKTTGCSWGDCSVWQYTEDGWELCAIHVPRGLPLNYVACQEKMGMDG